MSDKTEEKKDGSDKAAPAKAAPAKSGTPFAVRFAVFMVFVTAVIFLPTTIVVSVCMIPTLVAAIVDNHARKTAWLTVGAMNMAGTVPVWISLMDSGQYSMLDAGRAIPAAFQLIVQPSMLLLSYGGAAVGWFIYNKVTPLVAAIVQSKNERRLRDIDKRQKALAKKWGEGVVLK
jgi:hypothetical protein